MNRSLKSTIAVIGVLLATAAAASLKIRSAPAKDADVVLTDKNSVTLRGEVSDESVNALIKTLRSLDTDKEVGKPIYLTVYSPGGSIQSGIELNDAVKGLRRPVKTITIFAASMGFQIVQNLDERLITNG